MALHGDGLPRGLSVLSALLLFAAILTFVYAMQARVKTKEMVLRLRRAREADKGL